MLQQDPANDAAARGRDGEQPRRRPCEENASRLVCQEAARAAATEYLTAAAARTTARCKSSGKSSNEHDACDASHIAVVCQHSCPQKLTVRKAPQQTASPKNFDRAGSCIRSVLQNSVGTAPAPGRVGGRLASAVSRCQGCSDMKFSRGRAHCTCNDMLRVRCGTRRACVMSLHPPCTPWPRSGKGWYEHRLRLHRRILARQKYCLRKALPA